MTVVLVLGPVYRYNLYMDVDVCNEHFFDLYKFLKVGWYQTQSELILGWKEDKEDIIAVAIAALRVNIVSEV